MGLKLVTPAATLPVTAEQAKIFARIDGNAEDDLVNDLIAAAIGVVQELLGKSLAPQGWRLTLDAFTDAIQLPIGPVTAVTAVTYVDPDGVTQTLSPSVYTVDLESDPQWIVRNADADWPETIDAVNAVAIAFTAGLDDLSGPERAPYRIEVLQRVAQWYDGRGEGMADDIVAIFRRMRT